MSDSGSSNWSRSDNSSCPGFYKRQRARQVRRANNYNQRTAYTQPAQPAWYRYQPQPQPQRQRQGQAHRPQRQPQHHQQRPQRRPSQEQYGWANTSRTTHDPRYSNDGGHDERARFQHSEAYSQRYREQGRRERAQAEERFRREYQPAEQDPRYGHARQRVWNPPYGVNYQPRPASPGPGEPRRVVWRPRDGTPLPRGWAGYAETVDGSSVGGFGHGRGM